MIPTFRTSTRLAGDERRQPDTFSDNSATNTQRSPQTLVPSEHQHVRKTRVDIKVPKRLRPIHGDENTGLSADFRDFTDRKH